MPGVGGGGEGLARLELTYMNQHRDMGAIKWLPLFLGIFFAFNSILIVQTAYLTHHKK